MDKDRNRSFRAQKLMEKIKKELKVEIDALPEVFTRDEMYERIGELAALSFIKGDEGLRCISHTLTEDAFAGVPEEVARKAFELGAAKLPVKSKFVKRLNSDAIEGEA